ncbi:MAG: trypsin-like peptidase domain-containing protein, partial [Anaerolineales bacterium]|nr:trypsin-like peptidase domain-containing protein [Anaerolineales bacterium]
MSFDLRNCVVSIRHKDRRHQICGTGFVVDSRHILTCAHVVSSTEAGPEDTIHVKFAANDKWGRATLIAQSSPRTSDAAVLQLDKPIPDGVEIPLLSPPDVSETHHFRMFGYPAKMQRMDGIPGAGDINGETKDGRGTRWLALDSKYGDKGMSGAPIFDTTLERVVGIFNMTATFETGHFRDSDFATPIDLVQEIWPEMKLSAISPQSSVFSPQSYFYVPFPEKDDFVGREEDLINLHNALQGETAVGIRPAGLTGMGGIGKTQLAVKYVYDYREHYPDGVFWLNAARPLAEEFARVGLYLQPELIEKPVPVQIQQAANYLQQHDNALLVLDNLPDPTQLNRQVAPGLIPANLPRVMFTTRRRDLGKFTPVELKVLPPDVALTLLLHRREDVQQSDHPEHATANQICRMVGYLPLALEIAAAFLGEWPEVTLADFRERLEQEGLLATLDEEGEALPNWEQVHDLAVMATLKAQWEALQDQTARKLLQVAGQLPEAAYIPAARLGLLAGVPVFAQKGRPPRLQRALKKLEAASLVEELKGDGVRLHPLVREFAQTLVSEREQYHFRNECGVHLADAFEDFALLEQQCRVRGVDALIEDLLVGLELLDANRQIIRGEAIGVPPWRCAGQEHAIVRQLTPIIEKDGENINALPRVRTLLRLLQQEAHIVRRWNKQDLDFLQRLVGRMQRLKFKDLLPKAKRFLLEKQQPVVQENWFSTNEALALEQTLQGHSASVSSVAITPRRPTGGL